VPVRTIGVEQRRARLGVRHLLASGVEPRDGPAAACAVAEAMVALHATDPATVFLSVLARAPGVDVAAVEHALYADRALVRMLAMRRTVWVVPRPLAPAVQEACSRDVATVQRRRLLDHLARAETVPDPAAWLERVERDVVAALDARGEATAAELVGDVPGLRTQIRLPREPTGQNATSRVLLLLGADGHLVRGRPIGSWTSTRYRWAPASAWWPGGIPRPDAAAARVELARRWLTTFGPAPVTDLQWWAGWTLGRTRAALAALGAEPVDLDGEPGVALPDDLDDVPAPPPWVALLPALDPTPMGWQRRDWFLGAHRAALFDRTGNIGPTIWVDGRIVGGWAHRDDATIALRLLEDVGAEARAAVTAEAERLAALVGDVRVTPRFRTPLERELVNGPG
jgi:hypothetical protein